MMKAALLCIVTSVSVGLSPNLWAQEKPREGGLPLADRILVRFAFEVDELDRRIDDLPNHYDLHSRTSRTEAAGALIIHLMTVGDDHLPVPEFAQELWSLRMESAQQAAHALRQAADSKEARKHWDKATELLQRSAGLGKAIRDELGKRHLMEVYELLTKQALRGTAKPRPPQVPKLVQEPPQWNQTHALLLACMELQQQHVYPHWAKVMKQFPHPSCEAAQELYNASKGLTTTVMHAERDLVAMNTRKATQQLDGVLPTYNRLAKEFGQPPRTLDSPGPKLTQRWQNENPDKKPKLPKSAADTKTTEDSVAAEKTTDSRTTTDEKATDTRKPTTDQTPDNPTPVADGKATSTKKPIADEKTPDAQKPAAAWSRAKVEALIRTVLNVPGLNPQVSNSTLRNLNRLHAMLQNSVRGAADTTSGASFNRMSRDATMLLNAYNRSVPPEHRVTLESLGN